MKNNFIEFLGEKYPCRTLVVIIDGVKQEIEISTQDLEDDLFRNRSQTVDKDLAEKIDEGIYYYVDIEDIYRPAKQICENCLDDKHEFVEEVGEFMVAQLIDFSLRTRVVVNANATDEEIVKVARPKIFDKVRIELGENLDEVSPDLECPYGTFDDDTDKSILASSIKNYDSINSLDLRSFIESERDTKSKEKVEFIYCGKLEEGQDSWAIDVSREDDVFDTFLYSSEYEYNQDVKILKGE